MWVLGLSGGADSCDHACLRQNLVCDETEYNTGSSPGYAAGSAGTPAAVGSNPDSYDGLNNLLHVAQFNGGNQVVLPTTTDYIASTGKSFDYCPAYHDQATDRIELQDNHALYDCAAVSGSTKTTRQRICWCTPEPTVTPNYFFAMAGQSQGFSSGNTGAVNAFWSYKVDSNGEFHVPNGEWTCPRTAYYRLFTRIELSAPTGQYFSQAHLWFDHMPSGGSWANSETSSLIVSGGHYAAKVYEGVDFNSVGIVPIEWDVIALVSAGDKVRVSVKAVGAEWRWGVNGGATFGGYSIT